MGTQVDDYPIVLKAQHVAEILGIDRSTAYEYMRKSDFPTSIIYGKRIVYRDSLIEWIKSKDHRNMNTNERIAK